MVIDESSAFGVLQALPTLDDARRERAARLLRDYQGQQERLGQPLWPSRMAAMQQSRERVRTIFDNPLALDAEDGTFAAANAAAPGTGDRMRKREANILWLSNRYQADEADVRARYDFYKADAGAKWGTGTLDDEAFFSKAKGEVDQERATENRRMTIAQQAAQAAITGGSFLDAMQTSGAEDDADKRVFRESFGRVSKKLAPYRPLIQEVATEARRMMTSGEGADWNALAERLLTVPKEDRALVLDALGRMEGEQVEGGAGKTLAHAFARGLEDLIARTQGGAGGALRRQLQERVEFAAGMGEMVGLAPEETGQTLQELERFNDRQDDLRELAQDARAVAAGTLAPLQDVRVLGMNLTGAAENLPLTATAFVPMLGPAAMVAFFQDATDEELRREYPDMNRAERQKIATLAAPIQAATEVISTRLLFGRLPNLKRAFSSPAFTAGSISKQLAGRLALGTAIETAEELAQGVTSRAVMEIQQALGADVPEVDWSGYFQRFGDDLPELVSTIVPLALLGAGVGQVSDYQNAKALVSNDTLLKAAGYENAVDIKAAADAGQWRQVETLMREQWAKVAPKGQTVGEVAAAASETVIKQQTENVKAATEEVRKIREQNAEAKRMLDDAERRRLIPSIRRDAQGWSVTDTATGAILRVKSRDDAVAMAYEHLNEMERQSAVAMAQVADEFMGLRPGAAEAFEISTQARSLGQEVQAGRVTEEQGAEAVELYGLMHGLQPGEARAETIAVLGNNKAEEIEGIRTAVSRIWGGGNLITVMHEGIHGRWRAGLERGHYSQALGIQWVRMAERASGQQFLPVQDDRAVTPEMLEEAIVEVATADLIGRRKDAKQHFTPGLISRGVASYALSQRAEAKAAGRFATWLQGWKSFWGRVLRNAKALKKARAEGKLNGDFDALLDDLLGTEPQQRFEAEAAREAVDMAGGIDNAPFSLARAVPTSPAPVVEMPDGAQLVGPTVFSLRAFHGTPHKVDKFSTEKIGTGEGAQAYGWGLYFAESRKVASSYQKLADLDATRADHMALAALRDYPDPKEASAQLRSGNFGNALLTQEVANTAAEMIDEGFRGSVGNLYTVELLPDEDEFLDWDKPLSEQSEKVKVALNKALSKRPELTGAELYAKFAVGSPKPDGITNSSFHSADHASKTLLELGIPGIRYLDAGSRSAGDGSRNYVIFDENLVRILEENGKPVEAGAFSLAPRSLASVADTILAAQMRKPEFREALYRVAREKLDRLRAQSVDEMTGRIVDKTEADWQREMKAREGFEYDRLLRENFGADTTKKQEALPVVDRQAARSEARTFAQRWLESEKKKQPTKKERQMAALRTLDAILSAFPAEIRGQVGGFVQLAKLGTDKAREAEIAKRLDKLDAVVEKAAKKHYLERIEKVFDKAKPTKGKAGEKPKGKLGAATQALVDRAKAFAELDEAGVSAERAAIADRLAKATDPGAIADLVEREQLLDLFGALDERTSAELEAAADWLADTYQTGRNRWRAVIEQREQEAADNREQARAEIGKQGLDAEQQDALKQAKKIKKATSGMALSWLSFEQVMTAILGRKSKQARDTVAAARAATNQKTDAMRAKRQAFKDAMSAIFGTTKQREWQGKLYDLQQIGGVKVTKLEGARTETREVAAQAVERIINGTASAKAFGLDALTLDRLADAWADNEALPANRRKTLLTFDVPVAGTPTETELSQLQAVHLSMMARQAAYTEVLAGHGWTAEVMESIEKQLTPEAKAIRDWLAEQYRGGWEPLNAVYARMYGVNLPRIPNYAPGTFEARDMMGQDVDPYGQGLLSEGGFRAGMLKTRGKHNARPRLEDALSVYWGHVNATEHFQAFAEFARDLRAVMNNAEVRASITAKGGKDLLQAGQSWIEAFERNGLAARSASSRWDEFLRRRQAAQAYLALAYNMGTLMKQSTAALGALLNMGPGQAARQFAKLVTNQLDLKAAYQSDVIQRRLDAGYSPEVRQAMAAMMAEKPTWGTGFVQKGMEIIGMVDAIFTTASYAMAYDFHLSQAKAAGLNATQAKQQAEAEAEATVARTAQPAEMMDRSLSEIGMQPMAKFLFMFASEARQKAALWLDAVMPSSGLPAGQRATRLFLLHVVFPVAIQTITNFWRDAREDDDEELFDSDNWRAGDYAKSMILGPALGLPLIGQGLNMVMTSVFGGHVFANDPTQPLNRAIGGAEDIAEAISEGDLESGLKGMRSLMWALALAMGGERAAAVGAGTNILYDAFRVTENLGD